MRSYEAYENWAAREGFRPAPYRPSLAYRLAPVPFLLLGIASLCLYAFRPSDTVPESELTRVDGVPSEVQFEARAKRYGSIESLTFAIGGYKTYISEYHPKYDAVRSAVQSRKPLAAWLETKKKYSDNSKPLYKLMAGNRTLVAYSDTAEENSKGRESMLVVGTALTVAGVFLALLGAYQQQRYDTYAAELQEAHAAA